MISYFPKSSKTGDRIYFKTVDTAVFNAEGRTVADQFADLKIADAANTDAIVVERARIDNIIAESTENTVNNAELIDIRTGQDGVAYTTAGEAVRGQFLSVFNAIKEITKYTRNAAPEGVTIYDVVNTNRAKTELFTDYVTFPYICTVSVPAAYELSVKVYNYDDTSASYVEAGGLGTSGWVSKYVIPRNVPVVISLRRADGYDITKTEIVALTFSEEYPVALRNTILSAANFYNSLQYKVETLGDNTFTISKISTDILTLGRPIYVQAKAGYKCCVIRFKDNGNGTYTEFHNYGWSDEQLIPIGVPFIFSFVKTDNTLMTFEDFVNNFEVEELQHDDPAVNTLLNSLTGFGVVETNSVYGYELSTTQLTSLPITYSVPTTLLIEEQDNPIVLSYNIIENDVITYHSGWTKAITVPAEVPVRISFDASSSRSMYDIKHKSEFQICNHPFIKDIAQRGFSKYAPENTLVAFEQAALQGFKYVECDVRFTSDGIPVLLRDTTINRTSNGTGDISTLTFDTVRTYDFGSWFNSSYTGTKIPLFEEFIALCRNKGLHPYINFSILNQTYVDTLFNIIDTYGMRRNVTWVSGNADVLSMINTTDPYARLGLSVNSNNGSAMITDITITTVNNLKTEKNDVFITANYSFLTNDYAYLCLSNLIPLEVWNLTSAAILRSLHPYISGVSSSFFQAGKYLMTM